MDTNSISLARLIALGVPRTWQEAVAVAQEAAAAMTLLGMAVSPETCLITTAGEVTLTGSGPKHAGSAASLAALLAALLEAQTAPSELRTLVSSPDKGRNALEEFTGALAFFERPNRQADIAALAVRALAGEAESRAAAELDRLRHAPTPALKRELRNISPRSLLRPAIAVGVIAVAVLAAGAAWWSLSGPADTAALDAAVEDAPAAADTPAAADAPLAVGALSGAAPSAAELPGPGPTSTAAPAPAPAQSDAVQTTAPSTVRRLVAVATETLNGVADAGLRAIGLAPGTSAAPAPGPATPPAAPAASSAARPRPRRSTPSAPEPAPAAPVGAAGPAVAAEPPSPAPAESAEETEDLAPSVVYSYDDTSVEPPMMVRPQLPTEPRGDREYPNGYLELLVNERGTVDQVRLRGEPSQLNDRMLVSAAKAWQFRPAIKDGRPVRYVVRVPILQ